MNLTQKQIVEFIKSAINGEKINLNIDEQVDWESIINISREHKIEGLVYSVIPNKLKDTVSSELLNLWKKEVFTSGITQ